MTRARIPVAMVAAGLLTIATSAAAQFAKPEDAIRYRRAAFTVMGTHFGRVAAMASGKVAFDPKVAASNAEIATFMSRLPYAGFVDGSDKGDTNALPKIWVERDKFDAAAARMQEEMTKLNAAAKSGNLDAIKPAVVATGRACKACHDEFRKE